MTITHGTIDHIRALQHHVGAGNRARGFREDEELLDDVTREVVKKVAGIHAPNLDEVSVSFTARQAFDILKLLKRAKTDAVANRLLLVVGEVVEAHEEIRSGRSTTETYYTINGREVRNPTPEDGLGVELAGVDWIATDGSGDTWTGVRAKPEGFPSEIVDTIIRSLDIGDNEGIDIGGVIAEKDAYNATRPYKHGRKF